MKFREKIIGTWVKIKEKLFKRKSDDSKLKKIEDTTDSSVIVLNSEEIEIPAEVSRTTEEYTEWQKEMENEK